MEIDFSHLHHAYLLLGGAEAAEKALLSAFEKEGMRLKGSPDYFVFREPLLGIADARTLSEQAIRKAFIDRKVFFLAPEKLSLEAQNALLKTFEEPIENTHFFLVLREESLLIPTLLSRMKVVRTLRSDLKGAQGQTLESGAQKFLKLSLKERLNFVKKFVDKEQNLSVFLDGLLLELRRQGRALPALGSIYKLRLLSDDRGVSSRLILEHLALVV